MATPLSEPAGRVIEYGLLPDGTPYRIWQLQGHGQKTIGYIGGGKGKRRNVKWIRKTLREAQEKP